jgi:hypothetical protein
MIGLAALYSYIFTHPKFVLFLVPVIFSLIVIWHLCEEHKNVARIADYIREDIERWFAAARTAGNSPTGGPGGWEKRLGVPGGKSRWKWSPLPVWYAIFVITIVIAVVDWRWPSVFPG